LLDDLEVPREKTSKKGQGPLLQGLRQKGMVRVTEDLLGDAPGLLPLQPLLVEEDAHEFGNSDGRVSVVHLDGGRVRELLEVVRLPLETADDVRDGGGDEEILLFQPQFPPFRAIVVGIEDLEMVSLS